MVHEFGVWSAQTRNADEAVRRWRIATAYLTSGTPRVDFANLGGCGRCTPFNIDISHEGGMLTVRARGSCHLPVQCSEMGDRTQYVPSLLLLDAYRVPAV